MLDEKSQFKQLLGRQLREARHQKGFSIEKVAQNAETGTDHLGRIERGEKLPNTYTLAKLYDYLGIDGNAPIDIFNELKKHRPD